VIVTDDDVNVRNWQDVIWAITTRMDPARDCTIIENTPIDYLDFASRYRASVPRSALTPPIMAGRNQP